MARKNKSVDVQKFGGVESLGKVDMPDTFTSHTHELNSVETQSQTNLESDAGQGDALVIRVFKFGANPEVFQAHPPTKQELFNAHHKGIDMYLWKDGLQVVPEIDPRITVSSKGYTIFVTARPRKGYALNEKPQTLSEIAHG